MKKVGVTKAMSRLVEAVGKHGGVQVTTYPYAKLDADGTLLSSGAWKVQVAPPKNAQVLGTMTVYPDGSGAPAELTYRGLTYAFDMLGGLKVNGVHVPYGLRKERKVAVSVLTSVYEDLLSRFTDDNWLRMNREMYSS